MADVFAFMCWAPYSICGEMGTGHGNYVGSLFVRRPRARFTSRESKITLIVYVYPGSHGIRVDLFARFNTPERHGLVLVLLICGRSIRSRFLRFAFLSSRYVCTVCLKAQTKQILIGLRTQYTSFLPFLCVSVLQKIVNNIM